MSTYETMMSSTYTLAASSTPIGSDAEKIGCDRYATCV